MWFAWWLVLGVAANWDCWKRVRRMLYCSLVKLKLEDCWDSSWFVSVSLSFVVLIAKALLTEILSFYGLVEHHMWTMTLINCMTSFTTMCAFLTIVMLVNLGPSLDLRILRISVVETIIAMWATTWGGRGTISNYSHFCSELAQQSSLS